MVIARTSYLLFERSPARRSQANRRVPWACTTTQDWCCEEAPNGQGSTAKRVEDAVRRLCRIGGGFLRQPRAVGLRFKLLAMLGCKVLGLELVHHLMLPFAPIGETNAGFPALIRSGTGGADGVTTVATSGDSVGSAGLDPLVL
jgi:hypothetical protein